MKSHVAVYHTHQEAFKAVQALSDRKFPMDHVSLIGKADIIDDHIHVRNVDGVKLIPLYLSIVAGIVFGLMIGYKLVYIPGMTMTSDTFFVNVFWGASMGLVVGAILTILITVIYPKEKVIRYSKHFMPKRFLVIVNGSEEEIKLAQHILHTEGQFKAVA